jgi:hypothetical protein
LFWGATDGLLHGIPVNAKDHANDPHAIEICAHADSSTDWEGERAPKLLHEEFVS